MSSRSAAARIEPDGSARAVGERSRSGWSLIVVRGPGRGTAVPLVLPEMLLGRISSNEIILDDPTVSRVHARLRIGPDAISIEDLRSRSGTTVNGKSIRGPQPLQDGDQIVLGSVALVLAGPGGTSSEA